jgi:hypothetical protein
MVTELGPVWNRHTQTYVSSISTFPCADLTDMTVILKNAPCLTSRFRIQAVCSFIERCWTKRPVEARNKTC